MMTATCAGSWSNLTARASASSGEPGGIHGASCSRDMGIGLYNAVVDAHEKQAVRGRRLSRLCAVARRDDLAHPRRRLPSASDLDERADDGAHHVAQKAVPRDVVGH